MNIRAGLCPARIFIFSIFFVKREIELPEK